MDKKNMDAGKEIILGTVSPAGELIKQDWQKWFKNFYTFVAPTLAIFFAQLAIGVNWKAAGLVALLAFYQSLSDLFSKRANETVYTK